MKSLTLKKQMFPVKEQVPGNGKTLEGPVLKSLVIVSIFRAQVNHKLWVKPLLQQFRATSVTQSFEGFISCKSESRSGGLMELIITDGGRRF